MSIRGGICGHLMLGSVCLAVSCGGSGGTPSPGAAQSRAPSPFQVDLALLREHAEVVLLSDSETGAQVVVSPAYQGRVMTSTTGGADAPSFGWLGRAAIRAAERQSHMNVFGGEDRFWLGPEGGQYGLYFAPQDPFDLAHWQVPEPIDWGPWEPANQSMTAVSFTRRMSLQNYSRTRFELSVDRTVRLLDRPAVGRLLGVTLEPAVRVVAFESSNTVENLGTAPWRPQTGLLSIWILGMFNPSPRTTVVLPYVPGGDAERGPLVNDAYFGKVPDDRLRIGDEAIYFRGDGQYRSKIGLSPSRALSVVGSYDASAGVLTLVQYSRLADATEYVNSMWEVQREPLAGDVVNSYNDGPPEPGHAPLGPFYELETSSHALALAPGERYTHEHRTFHLVGPAAALDVVSRATLGVGLADIGRAFEDAAP